MINQGTKLSDLYFEKKIFWLPVKILLKRGIELKKKKMKRGIVYEAEELGYGYLFDELEYG